MTDRHSLFNLWRVTKSQFIVEYDVLE